MEVPPIIPDDRADKVMDQCPMFESRRARATWRTSDLLAACACVFAAIVLAALLRPF